MSEEDSDDPRPEGAELPGDEEYFEKESPQVEVRVEEEEPEEQEWVKTPERGAVLDDAEQPGDTEGGEEGEEEEEQAELPGE